MVVVQYLVVVCVISSGSGAISSGGGVISNKDGIGFRVGNFPHLEA